MGKIDDLRRLREGALAEAEKQAVKRRAAPAPKPTSSPASPSVEEQKPTRPTRASAGTKASSKSDDAAGEVGKCPACGKMKPLAKGVMASHQKGLGKACPGSRKKPG